MRRKRQRRRKWRTNPLRNSKSNRNPKMASAGELAGKTWRDASSQRWTAFLREREDASLHVFPANSPALAILGFLFDLEFLSGFVRHLRRRWRFRLIFYFAARQEES